MFACLNSNFTSPDCKDTCDDVITEDEYLMIANANCAEHAQPVVHYASGASSHKSTRRDNLQPALKLKLYDNHALTGIARVPPV